MKGLFKALILLVILVFLGGLIYSRIPRRVYICYIDKTYANTKLEMLEKYEKLQIPSKANWASVADELIRRKLVEPKAKDYILCYVKKEGLESKLKSGIFYVDQGATLAEALKQFTVAEYPYVKVTIPEGYRASQIKELLASAFAADKYSRFEEKRFDYLFAHPKVLAKEFEFVSNSPTLEGFLFPATYEFEKDATTEEVVKSMLKTFKTKALPMLADSKKKIGLTPYQALILASIIEKEATGDLTEKRMIADILLRRLKNGWKLQADAVLLYVKDPEVRELTIKDLKEDNPYNVYTRFGLPPTPICNPGVSSIMAAVNPAANKYWFYMHGKDGKVHYAVTYAQHLDNVRKYGR